MAGWRKQKPNGARENFCGRFGKEDFRPKEERIFVDRARWAQDRRELAKRPPEPGNSSKQ
jgi:hypothetical protein